MSRMSALKRSSNPGFVESLFEVARLAACSLAGAFCPLIQDGEMLTTAKSRKTDILEKKGDPELFLT